MIIVQCTQEKVWDERPAQGPTARRKTRTRIRALLGGAGTLRARVNHGKC